MFSRGRRLFTIASLVTILVACLHAIGNSNTTPADPAEATVIQAHGRHPDDHLSCLVGDLLRLSDPTPADQLRRPDVAVRQRDLYDQRRLTSAQHLHRGEFEV
jgi:hypothetical protein